MSEKRTVSRWLRSAEIYGDGNSVAPDSNWREGLLAEFEHSLPAEPRAVETEARAPLQIHHLALMAPAGVVLFGLGWALGSGVAVVEQMARISPLVWVLGAAVGSGSFLLWRGKGVGARR